MHADKKHGRWSILAGFAPAARALSACIRGWNSLLADLLPLSPSPSAFPVRLVSGRQCPGQPSWRLWVKPADVRGDLHHGGNGMGIASLRSQ